MTPEIQAVLVAAIAACLVAIVRRAVPRIDGPALVGVALSVAGGLVALALHYAPLVLATLPPAVSAAIVGALGSFVTMGGVELLRSMASKVDIDQRTMAAKAQSTEFEVDIKATADTAEAEAALVRLAEAASAASGAMGQPPAGRVGS